jgi:hypothetical protein
MAKKFVFVPQPEPTYSAPLNTGVANPPVNKKATLSVARKRPAKFGGVR